jgi:pimeloyl-ACP methyl ester carboxylesterase
VVLIHGYPLDSSSWEKQTAVLLEAGQAGHHLRPPIEIEGAPHGMLWTHGEEIDKALLDFLD